MRDLQTMWRNFREVLSGILNELSDQSAYMRHLEAHGASHSAEEWQRFCDERWQGKARRGRCC